MTADVAQLLSQVLALPEQDRAEVTARLIESLEPGGDEDVEAAWGAEIRQRLEDLETGKEQPIPWPEARRLIMEDGDEPGEG